MSNSISFVAKLGKDAERKSIQNGSMLKFSAAENVGWGERKTTNWWNCTIFGKQAESTLIDYLKKGAQVFITGEVSFREYEGKTYNELTVKHIELVGGKPQQSQNSPQQQPQQQGYGKPQNNSHDDSDLPF